MGVISPPGPPAEPTPINLETAAPEPDRPFKHLRAPVKKAQDTYQGTYWFFRDLGMPSIVAHVLAGFGALVVFLGGEVFGLILTFLVPLLSAFVVATLQVITEIRKEGVPQLNDITTSSLNELLGTSFTTDDLPIGPGQHSAVERARIVGERVLGTLEGEFTKGRRSLDPDQGQDAAHTFTGFVVNFSTASAFTALLIELGALGEIEEGRELGVQLAENLGLGRMARRGISELVSKTVADPYEWFLNKKYRPTGLSAGQAIEAFMRGNYSAADLHEALARAGYSEAHMNRLIENVRPQLSELELERLWRWGVLSQDEAVTKLAERGYDQATALLKLLAAQEGHAETLIRERVNLWEKQLLEGFIDAAQFRALLDPLPLSELEKAMEMRIVGTLVEFPRRQLTLGQMRQAFIDGIVDLAEWTEFLEREAYSADDRKILTIQLLLDAKEEAERRRLKEERDAERERRRREKEGQQLQPPPQP